MSCGAERDRTLPARLLAPCASHGVRRAFRRAGTECPSRGAAAAPRRASEALCSAKRRREHDGGCGDGAVHGVDVLVASLDARCSVHLLQHDPRNLRAEPTFTRMGIPFHSCGSNDCHRAQRRSAVCTSATVRRKARGLPWCRRSGTRRAPGPGRDPPVRVAEEAFDSVSCKCGGGLRRRCSRSDLAAPTTRCPRRTRAVVQEYRLAKEDVVEISSGRSRISRARCR